MKLDLYCLEFGFIFIWSYVYITSMWRIYVVWKVHEEFLLIYVYLCILYFTISYIYKYTEMILKIYTLHSQTLFSAKNTGIRSKIIKIRSKNTKFRFNKKNECWIKIYNEPHLSQETENEKNHRNSPNFGRKLLTLSCLEQWVDTRPARA
jgi:hypothetical protein